MCCGGGTCCIWGEKTRCWIYLGGGGGGAAYCFPRKDYKEGEELSERVSTRIRIRALTLIQTRAVTRIELICTWTRRYTKPILLKKGTCLWGCIRLHAGRLVDRLLVIKLCESRLLMLCWLHL